MQNGMRYFEGKPVTVLTDPINRAFPASEVGEVQYNRHFTGVLEKADADGLWLLDPATKVRSYFLYRGIVGVCELSPVSEDDPVVRKAMERAAKKVKGADMGVPLDMSMDQFSDTVSKMIGGAR